MRDSGLEEGRGEDRTPSRHTLNSLSLSLPLLPSAGRSSNVSRRRRRAMFLAPFQPRLLSYLRHAASPTPSISRRLAGGPHSVSASCSINDRLESGSISQPCSQAPPPHTPLLRTRARPISIIFVSFEDKSALFLFYLLPVPPSVHLSPSQWRRLPRLIARSPKPALRGSCCNEQETPDRPGGSELGEVRLKRFGPLDWITPTSHVTLAVFLCCFFCRERCLFVGWGRSCDCGFS